MLILDEPFSGLDPFNVELFKEVILELSKSGSMIIFSSHRMEHVELFCRKLVVLMHGKSVLSGYLKDIKEEYGKKNILIQGDIDIKEIKKIKGVIDVKIENDYIVSIENKDVASSVFKKIRDKNITKFVVEEPTLNEIFIEKVGDTYEK